MKIQYWQLPICDRSLPESYRLKGFQTPRLADWLLTKNRRPERPDGQITDQLWALMGSCWRRMAAERPTVANVVKALTK